MELAAPTGALERLPETGNKTYDYAVETFNLWLAGRSVNEDTLAVFFAGLKSGRIPKHDGEPYAPASINAMRSALKASVKVTFGDAMTARFAAQLDALFKSIKPAQVDRKVYKSEILSPKEVRALCEAVPEKHAALFRFLYASGLRISEALNLRLADCAQDGRKWVSVRVRLGKRRKERTVRISSGLFREVCKAFDSDKWLFENQRSKSGQYSRQYWHREIRLHGARALDREVHPHTLRHSHATTLLEDGANLKAVAQNLGHKDPAFTARAYVHSELSDESLSTLEAGVR